MTGLVTLPPGSGRRIEIVHSVDSLAAPQRMLLRHRLEGHESSWHDSGLSRRARYVNLAPGRYRFHAQARNADGRWGPASVLCEFRIAPHFWQAWYFYPVLAGAALAGAAGWSRWRLIRQQHRLEQERTAALEQERTRIARDLHDHLGALLAEMALSSGLSADAQLRLKQSLEELGDLIWLVSPENDTAGGWADFASSHASRFLGSAGITLDLEVLVPNPAQPLSGVLRHELAAVLKESLRNVLQHAGATRVRLQTVVRADEISLTLEDDGRGFEPSRPPNPVESAPVPSRRRHGLTSLRARAASLGGTCRIESAPGKGTKIKVTVPTRVVPADRIAEWLGSLGNPPQGNRTA